MGHGRGWSQVETMYACKAFTAASEDPRRGSDKKRGLFYKQVLEAYENMTNPLKQASPNDFSTRSGDAVAQRYRKAKCECLKFDGIIQSILSRKPTGSPSDADIARAALAVYNGEGNISNMYTYITDNTISVGTEFQFKQAYDYLKTTESWKALITSRSKVNVEITDDVQRHSSSDEVQLDGAVIGNEDSTVIGNEDNSNTPASTPKKERPMGNKRALEHSKQLVILSKGAKAIEEIAESSRKKAKVAEGLLEVQKQKSYIDLFSLPGTDPSKLQKFRELYQAKVLNDLEKRSQNKAAGSSKDRTVDDEITGTGALFLCDNEPSVIDVSTESTAIDNDSDNFTQNRMRMNSLID